MKTTYKYTILGILIASFFFPILSTVATIAPAQTEVRRFRIGTTTSPSSNWDIPVAPVGTTITTMFMPVCLETLVGLPDSYDRGLSEGVYKSDTYVGVLATDWTNDFWPEEMNSKGFVNQGGVANMTLRLREGVKFHDGSDWNATVAKWNIDRVYIISGNLTGRGDLRFKDTFWLKANDWMPYYTEGWNMSSYGGTDVAYPGVPDPSEYGYYDTITHGVLANPDPFGGYAGTARVDYAPYHRYPTVKRVVITDDQQSGGEIRVEFNDFNTAGMTGLGLVGFISMQAYADYWDTGIYGFDNEDPKDMIGTGPYIYEHFDDATGGGSLIKNYNYWNRTALEADGWFDADYIDIVTFPPNDAGVLSRNTAFMAHSLDFALDSHWTPVDIEDVLSEPRINYIERPVVDQISMIMLNCINETWWSWWPWPAASVESWYPTPTYPADNTPAGMPRALRKAVSYCFDYDTYINVGLNGRAVRSSSIGVNNLYYNSSIPIATYDVAIARDALLTDSYFAPLCAANGLDANSTDIEWQNVANGVGGKTPLWYLDFYWDNEYQVFKNTFLTCLENIGVTLTDPNGDYNKVPLTMWDVIQSYWVKPNCFPVFSAQGWPLDVNYPSKTPEGVTQYYYSDPNQGTWRPPYYQITDYFPWWNLAFTFDSNVDAWIKRLWLCNDTSRQEWFNKIADFQQNYQYSHMWICQHKQGSVVWRDWEISTYWASISYHLTRYVGFEEEFPAIPGFLTGIIMGISILMTVGIIYAVQRKIRFK